MAELKYMKETFLLLYVSDLIFSYSYLIPLDSSQTNILELISIFCYCRLLIVKTYTYHVFYIATSPYYVI